MAKHDEAGAADLPQVSKLGFYILAALINRPLHGYAIRQEIEQLTEKRLSPSAATLYENVAKLLDGGLIERAGEQVIGEGKVRKLYRITGVGEQVLSAELQALDRVRSTLPPKLAWAFK